MVLYLSSVQHTNLLDFISADRAENGITVKKLSGKFELKQFAVHDMRSFLHFQDVVLDRPAFAEEDREFIRALEEFLTMYDLRLTVICEGTAQSEPLFQGLLGIGIRNIVHGTEILEIQQEIRECLSRDGMMRYMPEGLSGIRGRERYHFTCRNVKIAVAGSQPRMGTTTAAVGLCAWLAGAGAGVCYVEADRSGHLRDLVRDYGMEPEGSGWVYEGVHYRIADMLLPEEDDKNFLVYDMGNVFPDRRELFDKADKKVLVCGTKSYELAGTMRLQKELAGNQLYLVCPFVADGIKGDLTEALQNEWHRVLFLDYQPELTDGSRNAKQYRTVIEKYIAV